MGGTHYRGVVQIGDKCKKAGWPRARLPHQHEGKVGQAWRARTEYQEGEDVFGNKKSFQVEVGPFLCRCGAIVRIDKNGFAACEHCGEIFNDGPIEASEKIKRRAEGAFRRDCINKSFI